MEEALQKITPEAMRLLIAEKTRLQLAGKPQTEFSKKHLASVAILEKYK